MLFHRRADRHVLYRRRWRALLASRRFYWAIFCAAGLLACHPAAKPRAAQLYKSIYSDFLRGDLDAAQRRARLARQDDAIDQQGDASWPLRFRLLEAEIQFYNQHRQDALALLTSVEFPSTGDLAIKRDLLSSRAHGALGNPEQAARELQAARQLAEASGSTLLGEVLQDEALVLLDAGRLDQAEQKFDSSLSLAHSHADVWLEATDLVDIGYLRLQSGHADQALIASQKAADFARSNDVRVQTQWAVGNAGWAYQDLGDFDSALSSFQQADQLALALGMRGARVLWLQDAGRAAYFLGDAAQAEKYDVAALQAAQALPAVEEADQIVNIQTNLAWLLYEVGRYDEATRYSDAGMLAAHDSKDDNVVAHATYMSGRLAARQAAEPRCIDLLMQAWKLTTDVDLRSETENEIANVYAARHDSRQAEIWYRRSIQTFEDKRSEVQDEALRLAAFGYGDSAYQEYARFLIDAGRGREALQVLDTSRARTLEEGIGLTAQAAGAKQVMPVQSVAARLNASILFYSLGAEKSYLWVVNSKQTQLYTLPKRQDIQTLVEQYQRVIQKVADPLESANSAATSLYKVLIEPAAGMIPSGSRIYLIPDGALSKLNFETLLEPTAQGLRYWIENVTLTVSSSIRMLANASPEPGRSAPERSAAANLLMIGNPVAASATFPALAHGADEIQRIRQHFQAERLRVFTQSQAVPAAYVSGSPEQFSYVHFVAHGTASRLSPLESAVVLSPASPGSDVFKLYAWDILQHRINARLVTISACYGSGIRAYAGEGLVGLAWAFLRAGAHEVISAQWEVNDDSTPELMDSLYGELMSGKSPDAALRSAKLALIHSAGVYRKPYYWATFQVYAGH